MVQLERATMRSLTNSGKPQFVCHLKYSKFKRINKINQKKYRAHRHLKLKRLFQVKDTFILSAYYLP